MSTVLDVAIVAVMLGGWFLLAEAFKRDLAAEKARHAKQVEALRNEFRKHLDAQQRRHDRALARALPPPPMDEVEWQRIKRAVGL